MIQETNHLEPVDARSTLHNILTHSGDSRELVGYLNVFLNDLQTYADACGPKPVSDKHVLYRIVHEVIVWLETISLPREHIRCSQMKSLLEPFDVRVQLKSFIEKPCVSHILDREHDLLDIIEGESDVTPQDIGIKTNSVLVKIESRIWDRNYLFHEKLEGPCKLIDGLESVQNQHGASDKSNCIAYVLSDEGSSTILLAVKPDLYKLYHLSFKA
jgi:hypothetical protein